MKKYGLVVFAFIFASCKFHHNPPSPYKDFSTRDGITFYKYCDIGSFHQQPKKGNVTEVLLSYAKMNDSVFWSSRESGYPYSVFLSWNELANGSTYERALLQANQGDSITYIVPADSVFKDVLKHRLPYFLHSGDMIKVQARISLILDSAHYIAQMKSIKEYKKDMDMQEQLTLLRYITANHIPDSAKKENIYFIPLKKGTGPRVETGNMISLAYKGSFLSGQAFDSVAIANPVQYKYGDMDQMIPGLDRAVKMMREGEEAKIIIPSQLAFGNNGSSTGIVPPYTTVVYEVTLLKVKALN